MNEAENLAASALENGKSDGLKAGLPGLSLEPKEFEGVLFLAKELENEFQREESVLKEIRDHFLPYRGKFFGENAHNEGRRNDEKLYNSEGRRSAKTFAAGLQSGVTSPARPWLNLKPSDPELADLEPSKIYTDEVQRRMQEVYSRSNFYTHSHTYYLELGPFGTAVMIIEPDPDDVIRCRTFTMGEYFLGLGRNMKVDKLMIKTEMTLAQLKEEYGFENLPENLQAKFGDHSYQSLSKKETVYQLIEPNPKYDPTRKINQKLPLRFRSVHWIKGQKSPLKVGGYHEQPFMALRWDVIADRVYGKGAGHETLGDVKQLQVMEKDGLLAIAKKVNPPILVPDAAKTVNVYPGGVTRYNPNASGGGGTIQPTYAINLDIRELREYVAEKEMKIGSDFYVDLFKMMISTAGPQRTAMEVSELHEEKMILLGPLLERIFPDFLDPAVERVFGIMQRMGLLPDPPEELEEKELKIEYVSVLAQAQKMIGMKGVHDFLGTLRVLSEFNQEAAERLDVGEAVDFAGDMHGVPPGLWYGNDKFQMMKAEKMQKQQEMERMAELNQGIDMAGKAAQVAKTLGGTPTNEPNALSALAGANGQ